MIDAIYANTWEELTGKMIGYFHDHCHHLYTGLNTGVPEHLWGFVTENDKYVFIYEEDEPYKP